MQAADIIRTWFISPATAMRPNLNFPQMLPGLCDGQSSGIIDTRCGNLASSTQSLPVLCHCSCHLPYIVDATSLISGSPHWTTADQSSMDEWLQAYFQWLQVRSCQAAIR
jgi:hypothetical protein